MDWGTTRLGIWAGPRRRVPLVAIAVAMALAVAAGAAGCGSSGGIEAGSSASGEQVDASGPVDGKLTISQWPLYIDPGKNGTVAEFENRTGAQVGKLQPQLAKGESGGRDLITLSDWLAKQMYDSGYIQKLDYSKLPNVRHNLIEPLRHPAADPKREFTVPWQSGMTGLIVNTDMAPGVDSICDLFDPKYKGKVDMLTELRDTVPMTLKCMGIDPDHATTDQWLAAVDKVKEAADSGQIRRFTGNDYIRDLSSGDVDFVLGWSGTRSRCKRTTRTSSS